MIKFHGCGLENVYLLDGYKSLDFEGTKVHSYVSVKDLYVAIGRAIALSRHPLTGHEFRFLRKALGWSQTEAGAILDKTSQAVAKWEKEVTPVPRADGHIIRLAWLRQFEPVSIPDMVNRMFGDHPGQAMRTYVFSCPSNVWKLVEYEWAMTEQQMSRQKIEVQVDILMIDSDFHVYKVDALNEYGLEEFM
jgi:DNA-binding transcriptional regulator YiaG